MRIAFGPVTASIEGDGRLASEVLSQLDRDARPDGRGSEPDLQVVLLDGTDSDASLGQHTYHCCDNLSSSENVLRYRTGHLTVVARNLFGDDGPCRVSVAARTGPNLKRAIGKVARSVLRSLALSRADVVPSIDPDRATANAVMSYQVFWFVLHVLLLRRGGAFLHGAALELPGRTGLALVGTGGCGKTSTCFQLLGDPGVRYLSEDFTIIASAGSFSTFPRHLTECLLSDVAENAASFAY